MKITERPRKNGKNQDSRSKDWIRGLRRPEIWSVFVAVCALLLSQLPPISSLIKGKSIRVNSVNIATLTTEYIGFPAILVNVGVENVGGQPAIVQRFTCDLTHNESGKWWEMPVYMSMLPSEIPSMQAKLSPVGWISLNEGEVWSAVIICGSAPTDEQLRAYSEIANEFRQSINEQLSRRRVFPSNSLVQVSEDLFDKAQELFDKQFGIAEGSYDLNITAIIEAGTESSVKKRFLITSFAVEELRSTTEFFKFGAGVIYPSQSQGVTIRLSERDASTNGLDEAGS